MVSLGGKELNKNVNYYYSGNEYMIPVTVELIKSSNGSL